MLTAIQFLESAGSRPLMLSEYEAAVRTRINDQQQQRALLARDDLALIKLLGGRDRMQCMIMVPEES